jgi:4-amino-4-deoxy-L-arabinose transferase-like glycosyltransferase
MKNKSSKRALVHLITVAALALSVRVLNFVGPVRGDDFRYLSLAYDAQFGEITSTWSAADRFGIFMPISWLYRIFGVNEITGVAFPLFFSVLTVVLVYFIGKQLRNAETGLAAALIWAGFPLDVVNSTQVLPDSILATYAAGAVLLLLLGISRDGRQRFLFWVGSLSVSILAFYTKDIGALNGLFCVGAMVLVSTKPLAIKAMQWVRESNKRGVLLIALAIIGVIFIYQLRNEILIFPNGQPINLFAQTATDFFGALILGVAPFGYAADIPGREGLFDLVIPLLIIALASQAFQRKKEMLLPLAWMGFLFVLSEWGTEALRFPINYRPPDPELVSDRRHLLFMMLPVVVVIGSYLSSGLKKIKPLHLVGLALVASLITYLVRNDSFTSGSIGVLERVFVLALLTILSLPFFQFQKSQEIRIGMKRLALFLLVIGSLLPMGRYHVNDWHKEQTLMGNLRSAAELLSNTASNNPIITIPGNDHRLDYASDFELGINWDSIDYIYPNARITSTATFDEEMISYYIVFEETANLAHRELIDPAWENVAMFGEEGHSRITIYFSNVESAANLRNYSMAYATH